jgi:hypothetical protein
MYSRPDHADLVGWWLHNLNKACLMCFDYAVCMLFGQGQKHQHSFGADGVPEEPGDLHSKQNLQSM